MDDSALSLAVLIQGVYGYPLELVEDVVMIQKKMCQSKPSAIIPAFPIYIYPSTRSRSSSSILYILFFIVPLLKVLSNCENTKYYV